MTFRRLVPVAVVVALAVVAVASADLKRPHEGVYTGDNGTVQARVWVDIVHKKPFRAEVVQQGPSALESGDPNTAWVAPTTCSDGTNQPFSLSPSKDLRINNRTGGFHDVVDTDEPLGTDGNIVIHIEITGKVNGTRANGTVNFSRTVNDPHSTFIPSCTTNGPKSWKATLAR